MQSEPVVAEASMRLHQPEAQLPGEVVPGSQDPGSGGLHRLLGGEVWIVTCACTQASWWLQPQPQHFTLVSRVCTDNRHSHPSLELI